MLSPRADELQARLNQLREWAMSQTAVLWSRVDAQQVVNTWAPIGPAILEVHTALVVEALEAVDLFMFCMAADAGWRYDTVWTDDRPTRPTMTSRGRPAAPVIRRAPIIAMWRMKQGRRPTEAMQMGLNFLQRVMGSEAHAIGREVMTERFLARG